MRAPSVRVVATRLRVNRPPTIGCGPRPAARRGFTIVELVVAIVILSIGMLGLASTAAVVTRQIGGGAQQTIAASLAESRFEALRARSCVGLVGGTAATRGITEVWTVATSTAARARVVTDTVKWSVRGRLKRASYTSMIPCIP
jgi:prepilin-type N-terminal cleavage/methylation domain-containing protein